jgi:hypothetical protein
MEIIGTIYEPNMRAWIAALRSENYGQARGKLSHGGCFCCLGVACEIAPSLGFDVTSNVIVPGGDRWYYFGTPLGSTTALPGELGPLMFGTYTVKIKLPCGCLRSAAEVNDELEWTFEQIADGLEHTYLGAPYPDNFAGTTGVPCGCLRSVADGLEHKSHAKDDDGGVIF